MSGQGDDGNVRDDISHSIEDQKPKSPTDITSEDCFPSENNLVPKNGCSSSVEEDFIIFHCVSYLGASSIENPKSENEIQKIITFLNEQSSDKVIQVSVSVPLHSEGYVIVYEEENQKEISRFKINQIIFFARGLSNGVDAPCFAFSCSHGESLVTAICQCHAFRCDVPEAVGRVFQSFARAFESPVVPDKLSSQLDTSSSTSQDGTSEVFVFNVSLEIKEDDGKGSYSSVPRDKGFFKLRSGVAKCIVLTVQQLPDHTKELQVERCFGLLLSPGRHVRHSDMQLVEMLSWSIGSHSPDRKSYVITGQWDCNDPAFESLNQETPKDSGVFFTVAVDLVIKGIQEPIRFALETKAKVYPSTERFWLLGRKLHCTQQFEISVNRKNQDGTSSPTATYQVFNITPLGEVDKNKINFNLNFTSFIRSSSAQSIDLETPSKEDEDSDDDEPLQSGVGEISKYCSDEQITAWSDIVASWPPDSITRPKQLPSFVRAGIPNTIRGEIWLRLSNCQQDAALLETYKTLLGKECTVEDVIQRDITRTFPANDYFKDAGSGGQEQLLRISKAYAVYDTEVGYCQGISFIGAALLLQMPEEQSFCLLAKMMYDYGFRDFYRDGFENLHMKLYQLDKLIGVKKTFAVLSVSDTVSVDLIPELYHHFQELGVESHMYASQWFLTMFTAKFPLVLVFRIIDLFLLDGIKSLFQIAIALLMTARKDLLVLDFEGILKYFRVSLPKKFRTEEASNTLVKKAVQVKVKKLKRYQKEYLAIKEEEKSNIDPQTRLLNENKKLMEDMLRNEHTITSLVLAKTQAEEDFIALEDELSKNKMSLKETEDFNMRLKEETNSVKELFQKEIKQYELEAEKKANIISEYKKVCSTLSNQLEMEQQLSRERLSFFQTNLCPECSHFVSTAINIASNKGQENGEGSPLERRSPLKAEILLPESVENHIKPLENELAKTKIALAEAECRNDDLNHQLSVALAELEAYRSNTVTTGPAWLWKNLTFHKDKDGKKQQSSSSVLEDSSNHSSNSSTQPVSLSASNSSKK